MNRGLALSLASARRRREFFPTQDIALSAWLRLQAGSPSGGKYDTWVDVLNDNPATQAVEGRRPTAATSANGLPIMQMNGANMLALPLIDNNNDTTVFGLACWVNFAAVAATDQILYAVFNAAGGASRRKIQTGIATSRMRTSVWSDPTSSNGRNISSALGVITAATWLFFRVEYISAIGGDLCVNHYLNELPIAQEANSNIGAGGTLGTLQTATGNGVIGSQNDADAPTRALVNGSLLGPNLFFYRSVLTAARARAFMNFERPT